MRFNKRNWNNLFTSGKVTTIRLKPSRIGHHKAYAGSYFKPEVLGEFDIIHILTKRFCELDDTDAIFDGFKSAKELKEARPNRIGIVYATQYFGQIPQDIELNTDYIISFQQTKEMGKRILDNFDGLKSMITQIVRLPKFQAIVAAKVGESLVVYDTAGKRTLTDDGTPFKGLVFPPVSQHSPPKQEGI